MGTLKINNNDWINVNTEEKLTEKGIFDTYISGQNYYLDKKKIYKIIINKQLSIENDDKIQYLGNQLYILPEKINDYEYYDCVNSLYIARKIYTGTINKITIKDEYMEISFF